MNDNWKIKDLIDLEYFLGRRYGDDDGGREPETREFDRNAYLSFAEESPPADESSYRRRLIWHWLEKRREYEKTGGREAVLLPGDIFSDTMRIARVLVAVVAMIFGAGLAWSLLTYTGRAPVNVFTCLWVLVVPQLLLLLVLTASAALSRMRIIESFRVVYPVLTAIMTGMLRKTGRFAEKRIDAGTANRIAKTYALLGKTRTIYGSVFFWPVFLTAQMAGVFYNAGILSALFLKVAITDLAFGWQTTLQLSPESVLRFVETAAFPWSWLFSPPAAHPTLGQIAGSQMILKDGIFHLATGDLVAWWPFILLTVAFYGLLPRLLLACAGLVMKYRALASIDFNHAACDRLVMWMMMPRVKTAGRRYRPEKLEEKEGKTPSPATAGEGGSHPEKSSALVLIPMEIFAHATKNGIQTALADSLGIYPAEVIPVDMDAREDSRRLRQALPEKQDKYQSMRIVVIQEAWQPPIKENTSWIRELRAAAGGTAGMIIALIGKPVHDTIFTSPSDGDRDNWEQAVNRLQDPYIRIESLGGNAR